MDWQGAKKLNDEQKVVAFVGWVLLYVLAATGYMIYGWHVGLAALGIMGLYLLMLILIGNIQSKQ